uniref:Bacteriophage/plasmid primase P4 C-terminal domain-containing protein n=1 Tax=Rhipiliopsis peltata TaxID=2320810 RepID=A0A386B180_9CHLO|nr:hypothetical protein [Rhipiliopsis peltata]AYC65452.1 hypothetical protein [Rhipiliopsis peltata]
MSFQKKMGCAPEYGFQTHGEKRLSGWWLKTSTEDRIFCLDADSRQRMERTKYLYTASGGLPAVLFVANSGLVTNISDEVRQQLGQEGAAITEGWKGGLALCYTEINCFSMHGCQGGKSVFEFCLQNNIPLDTIHIIFADTDVLWNPAVNKAYSKMLHWFENAKMVVMPPSNFLTQSGTLNFAKDSPDNWIEGGFTKEMVYEKVVTFDIKGVSKQLEHQAKYHLKMTETLYTSTKELKEDMFCILKDFLEENAFYIPKMDTYYVFKEDACVWEQMELDVLSLLCIKKFSERKWPFQTVLEVLKSARAYIMTDVMTLNSLFNCQDILPFKNSCWHIKDKYFVNGLVKDNYLLSTLPFEYTPLKSANINTLAPTICHWLCERVENSELCTNVLSAVMFACILQIQHPERFLFLTGHSATGKSTFFLLLTKLIADSTCYTISAEDFSCDFGLEDLAEGPPKSVVIFHDIGSTENT